ncbi:MAG: autotransporter domain-containing protein [Oricola sp.]
MASANPLHAEVIGLGYLPGYDRNSFALDISADGSVAVGYATNAATYAAFLWAEGSGMSQIGSVATLANAVSGDGQTVAGEFYNADHMEAFVWTAGGGFQPLGTGGFTASYAEGISASGEYVVGRLTGAGQTWAFVWTQAGGIESLGFLTGGRPYSVAMDVSDGGIVVGNAQVISGSVQAFYKELANADPIQGLGYLVGGDYSIANAITPDAAYIVGAATDNTSAVLAVRWEAGAPGYNGPVALDGVSGWAFSEALGISADGKTVVGRFSTAPGSSVYSAFRWAEGGNAQSLDQWLASTGVDVTGWTFNTAEGISDDGETIVGSGHFNSLSYSQAFVARAGIVVGVTDYTESVASLREVSRLPSALSIAWATQGLPETSGMEGLSVSGLYSHADGSASDLGGGMLTWRRPGLAVSAGGGAVAAETSPLYEGGSARFGGGWFGGGVTADIGAVFGASALEGLELGGGLRADALRAEVDRNYLNGAAVETASGETDVSSVTTAARIAWRRDLTGGAKITPYAQWLHNHTAFGAYAESGGAGAGVVAGQSDRSDIVSVGAEFEWQVRPDLELGATYAFNHMIDAGGSAVSVSVPGLGTFSAPGIAYDADWHTIGASLGWSPKERVRLDTAVSANFGSDYPENWTIGSRLSFGL